MNTVTDPNSPPIKTSGTVISMTLSGLPVNIETSSRKALKRRKQAKLADPTE